MGPGFQEILIIHVIVKMSEKCLGPCQWFGITSPLKGASSYLRGTVYLDSKITDPWESVGRWSIDRSCVRSDAESSIVAHTVWPIRVPFIGVYSGVFNENHIANPMNRSRFILHAVCTLLQLASTIVCPHSWARVGLREEQSFELWHRAVTGAKMDALGALGDDYFTVFS